MKKEKIYSVPSIEVSELKIERGFAASAGIPNEYSSNGGAGCFEQGQTFNI